MVGGVAKAESRLNDLHIILWQTLISRKEEFYFYMKLIQFAEHNKRNIFPNIIEWLNSMVTTQQLCFILSAEL